MTLGTISPKRRYLLGSAEAVLSFVTAVETDEDVASPEVAAEIAAVTSASVAIDVFADSIFAISLALDIMS